MDMELIVKVISIHSVFPNYYHQSAQENKYYEYAAFGLQDEKEAKKKSIFCYRNYQKIAWIQINTKLFLLRSYYIVF